MVLHYAQEIFEGFKVYRQPDGSVCLFRPRRNLERFNNSAARLCMPAVDIPTTLDSIVELIRRDADHLPQRPQTLYVRPCMIATDTVIGVHPSHSYLCFVIMCVVGEYFGAQDPLGVRLRTETEYVRAAPGGTGAAKCGGNYAASLAAQGQAHKDGFDQVVWLDGRERKFIEEMGGMNIMFVLDDTLVTPTIATGSILPGITRESLLQLARAQGRKVEERMIFDRRTKYRVQSRPLEGGVRLRHSSRSHAHPGDRPPRRHPVQKYDRTDWPADGRLEAAVDGLAVWPGAGSLRLAFWYPGAKTNVRAGRGTQELPRSSRTAKKRVHRGTKKHKNHKEILVSFVLFCGDFCCCF